MPIFARPKKRTSQGPGVFNICKVYCDSSLLVIRQIELTMHLANTMCIIFLQNSCGIPQKQMTVLLDSLSANAYRLAVGPGF